jgi:hypothetical protein
MIIMVNMGSILCILDNTRGPFSKFKLYKVHLKEW